jgi:hypothetical protein
MCPGGQVLTASACHLMMQTPTAPAPVNHSIIPILFCPLISAPPPPHPPPSHPPTHTHMQPLALSSITQTY